MTTLRRTIIKIKYLLAICALATAPLASSLAQPAEGMPGATVRPEAKGDGRDFDKGFGKGMSPEERQKRMEVCKADPEKCRTEKKARMDQWCKDNPQRCKEMKEKMEKRRSECQANPEKCRAEKKARMEEMCKANPERCKAMKERMEKRQAECKANPEKCRMDKKAQFEQYFKRADVDGNGVISREEAQKYMPGVFRHFDRLDANGDGQLTREEIAAVRNARMERRKPNAERTSI